MAFRTVPDMVEAAMRRLSSSWSSPGRSANATPFSRHTRKLIATVAPPLVTAENPCDHTTRAWRNLVGPDIDRHRMTQILQADQPQCRKLPSCRMPCPRKPDEVAIGKRQHRHIGRRLLQVDRFGEIVERSGRYGERCMRQPASISVMRLRSSPLRR